VSTRGTKLRREYITWNLSLFGLGQAGGSGSPRQWLLTWPWAGHRIDGGYVELIIDLPMVHHVMYLYGSRNCDNLCGTLR